MSYLNDVFYTNPVNNTLYKMTNDGIATGYPLLVGKTPSAVLVASDMNTVLVANSGANTVSIFKGNALHKTVSVGTKPIGICESPNGDFYVSNYGSNSITKIPADGSGVKHIRVGKYPKGICCSNDNTVYVASFGTGSVAKIVDDKLITTIKVGTNPNGICVDKNGVVWVANTSSHTVSRIAKDNTVTNISVPNASPYDICIDKNGNKWVTGYSNRTVYRIVGTSVSSKFTVGYKPSTICCNDANEIYVFNYDDGNITKISNGNTTTISTDRDTNTIGGSFGDPTGYQAYILNKYNPAAGGNTAIADGSIGYSKLDPALQAMITAAGNSSIELPIDDKDVTHDHTKYTTVKKALDHLLYEAPVIKLFSNDINTVEMGTIVTDIVFNWGFNKDMLSATIDNGVGDVKGSTTKTFSGQRITGSKTFTLTASDGKSTVTKTTSITFQHKIYWGAVATSPTNSADVLALGGNKLAAGKKTSATFNCSGGKYIVFAMPTNFGLSVNDFKIGGLANSAWNVKTVSVTNALGYTTNYSVFTSQNIQNGSAVTVDIV